MQQDLEYILKLLLGHHICMNQHSNQLCNNYDICAKFFEVSIMLKGMIANNTYYALVNLRIE